MGLFVDFKHKGFLVSCDGVDGAGKSTLVRKLANWLEDHNYKVFTTAWNSSSWVEPAIQEAKERRLLTPLSLTLASATDLCDRIEREIKPELEKGRVVICDRYISSAIARGVVRGVDEDWIRELYSSFLIKPNLGFYLSVSPKEARDRLLADKGRVGHHESGSDVLGKEKDEPENEDETNKRNFLRFMEKQIPIFNRLAKEFKLVTIDTHTKKRKVRSEAEDVLKEALNKHPTVLKKALEESTLPPGKLKIPGATRKVTVYTDTSTERDDTPSPRFVPETEQVWYDKMHGLQGKALYKLRRAWGSFKQELLQTIEKDLEEDDLELASSVTEPQQELFDPLLQNFNEIAGPAFLEAVGLGNEYFQDQFQVNGLNQDQQKQVADKHFDVFQKKSQNLFKEDVISNLGQTPLDEWAKTLNHFDKYLVGYANVVTAVAYDTFTKNITLLNKGLAHSYALAKEGYKESIIKVVWVLDPEAAHSDDCWNMSELDNFGYGPGIWDADYLSQNNLVPRSSALDCGGNCKCHLSPLVPLEPGKASWLDNMIKTPKQENILEMIPNLSHPEFVTMLERISPRISKAVKDILAAQVSLRRKELWDNVPILRTSVTRGNKFRVSGQTDLGINAGGEITGIDNIALSIVLGPDDNLGVLTAAQKQQVVITVAHELGHIIVNDSAGDGRVWGAFGEKAASTLYGISKEERGLALGQIQVNFENAVSHIAKDSLTPEIRRDISMMQFFNENPIDFLDALFESVLRNRKFGGIPARDAWNYFDKVLQQYSPGVSISRSYQLWNTSEYFADWFALLVADPQTAALFSPRLNKAAAELLPGKFFDSIIRRRVQNLLPGIAAPTLRLDLPKPSGFVPIAPNLTSYARATRSVTSMTRKVSQTQAIRQITDIIKAYPNMQRQEFFENLGVTFADKTQIANRVGSTKYMGYFDPERKRFFVNWDKWVTLSAGQQANLVGDMVAQQFLHDATPVIKREINSRFVNYLDSALRYLERKGAIQGLRPDELRNIRELVVGQTPIEDEATGEMRPGIPRNLLFWVRNFESVFKPILNQVTDIPILNVDSLASPRDYFRVWSRMYLTAPASASVYPGFRETLLKYLGLEKSLELEKAFNLGAFVGRVVQMFENKEGFWVTSEGRRIFVTTKEAAGAERASINAAKLGSLLERESGLKEYVGKLLKTEAFTTAFTPQEIFSEKLLLHEKVEDIIDHWSASASDSDLVAWKTQMAAAEIFGLGKEKWLDSALDWNKANLSSSDIFHGVQQSIWDPHSASHHLFMTSEEARSFVVGSYEKEKLIYQSTIKGMYELTQGELAARGITELEGYRGMAWPQGGLPNWASDLPSDRSTSSVVGNVRVYASKVIETTSNPLTSWSLSRHVGTGFAAGGLAFEGVPFSGTLLRTTIPAKDVISLPNTGFGVPGEQEFVVAGHNRFVLASKIELAQEK